MKTIIVFLLIITYFIDMYFLYFSDEIIIVIRSGFLAIIKILLILSCCDKK